MGLELKISEELKNATKAGDKPRLETLRSIRAAIIEFNKSGVGREMNADDELKILSKQVKQRKDSIEQYEKGNRQDLAEKEKQELTIIEEFLPKQLSEDEIITIVNKIIANTEINSIAESGKVMGPVMKELKGKADGSLVQKLVKKLLEEKFDK